ncbi:MAG: cell division protein FtsQ/DivIB [Azoarcus sp.]|nr:cell division protein FtsQ/DivIB [Azoarcus sp.]MDD2873524.1 cell division protein FtsQ/DivIB [Azoarcus sp.]MDX9836105.1 cell division protein FtsQ/DivIB [Azoarcus sp.]
MAEARLRSAAAPARKAGRRTNARDDSGLWNRPALLDLLSDLLMLFAAIGLGWALVTWFLSRPLFPLRELVVLTPPGQVTEAQLQYVARTAIRGNFFTIELDSVRAAFEKLPWVRRAEVRRRWPDGIELRLEEHQAVAYWTATESGETRLVNRQGEVFTASSDARMPAFSGPQGSAATLLARYQTYSGMLKPMGASLMGLMLSAREAWQLKLDNGVLIVLGREQERAPLEARLKRFVAAWPEVQDSIGLQVAVADLRYPGGFALTPIDAVPVGRNQATKGKK